MVTIARDHYRNRLTHSIEVAQIAACIGRDFDYDLLAAASGLPEDGLRSSRSTSTPRSRCATGAVIATVPSSTGGPAEVIAPDLASDDRAVATLVELLGVAAELGGEAPQLVLAAREEHAVPAVAREQSCRLLADARRRACDDGDLAFESSRHEPDVPFAALM